jgi:metallo-beta-lactamase class B
LRIAAATVRAPLAAALCASAASVAAQVVADPPSVCEPCDAWNAPQEPFRIFGNTYYVGTAELSAILVTGDDGHVLIDTALPQSAPLIDANIASLGFRTADVRLILHSHAHFDHVGGLAALQRASGAAVATSPRAAEALRLGDVTPDDPQYDTEASEFPRVENVRVIADGETLSVGDVRVTAHFTPGHTPGSLTWTWRSCEGSRCLDVVYADSLTPVSADDFRFTDKPSLVAAFERSIDTVAALPCDIVLAPHPGFIGLQEKLRRLAAGDSDAFVDANGCRAYADAVRTRLRNRLAEERAGTGGL